MDGGWVIVAGALLTWPVVYVVMLNVFAVDTAKQRRDRGYDNSSPLIDGEDRWFAAFIGFMCALVWPVALLFGIGYLAFRSLPSGGYQPRAERRRLAEIELRELRRKVREYEIKGGQDL